MTVGPKTRRDARSPLEKRSGFGRMTHESMGKRIQRLRRERGLTQEQAAEALGVTAAAVSKWETTAASRTFLLGSFRQALAEDETFRPLRDTPAFQALLARLAEPGAYGLI